MTEEGTCKQEKRVIYRPQLFFQGPSGMRELKSHFHIQRFLQEDPKPAVILYVGAIHPESDQMLLVLDALRKRYDGRVRFGFANVSRLISSRRALNIDSIPLVWLVDKLEILEVLRGADAKILSARVDALAEGCLKRNSSEGVEHNLEKMLSESTELAKQRASKMVEDELLLFVGPASVAKKEEAYLRSFDSLDQLAVVVTTGTGSTEYDEELGEAFCEGYGGWHDESYIFIEGVQYDSEDLHTCVVEFLDPLMHEANVKMRDRLFTKLKALINQSETMLFMKGTKERPFCKFSKEIVRILNEADIDYDYFNIFTDESVREGLKRYSRWPTYPQLYVRGELVGGLDIIKQMIQEMDGPTGLKDALLQIPA